MGAGDRNWFGKRLLGLLMDCKRGRVILGAQLVKLHRDCADRFTQPLSVPDISPSQCGQYSSSNPSHVLVQRSLGWLGGAVGWRQGGWGYPELTAEHL
jgi:hypothetical protein